MLAPLIVELTKLNRSLAALLAVAAPGLIGLFVFFNLLRGDAGAPWEMITMGGAAIWAFFMLPMSVTALTALVANMEHGPRAWDHLHALPVPRWRLYAAKAVSVLVVVALMSAAVFGLVWAAASAAGWIKPAVLPLGAFPAAAFAGKLGLIYLSGLLLIAVQLWAALRFRSFVPPLVLGIGGTFFAVVATSAKEGVFLPWQMPVNMLASEPERLQLALALGSLGGLAAFGLMLVHLSRREVL